MISPPFRSLLSLTALVLAACDAKAPPTPSDTPLAGGPASGCVLRVEKPWQRYTADATTTGKTCSDAVVALTLRAPDGSTAYTWSGATADLFGLKDAPDIAAMKPALEDWISNSGGPSNTSELPAWEETEGQPKRAEFPFHPEAGVDQTAWDKLKAARLEMFCFPQGGESMLCVAQRDGKIEPVGLQQFPG